MSVIPVTVFFSLGLVFFFVVLFLREQRHRVFASAERASLLPLAEEQARVVGQATVERSLATRAESAPGPGGAHPDDAACGCASGPRALCAHCQSRPGQLL